MAAPHVLTVSKIFEAASLIAVIVCSVIANVTAIFVIATVRALRQTTHNMLIVNLCVSDLGLVVASMAWSLVSVLDGGRLLIEHPALCKMNAYGTKVFSVNILLTILSISVDRTIIVRKRALRDKGLCRISLMIALSWSLAIVQPFNLIHRLTKEGEHTMHYVPYILLCSDEFHDQNRISVALVVAYICLTLVLVVCYAVIISSLWNSACNIKARQDAGKISRAATTLKSVRDAASIRTPDPASLGADSSGIEKCEDEYASLTQSFWRPAAHSNNQIYSTYGEPEHLCDPEVGGSTLNLVRTGSTSSTVPGDIPDVETRGWFEGEATNTDEASPSPSPSPSPSLVHETRYYVSWSKKSGKVRLLMSRSGDRPAFEEVADDVVRDGEPQKIWRERVTIKRKRQKFATEKRVTAMGALLVMCHVIFTAPTAALAAFDSDPPPGVGICTTWLFYCVAVVNPLIYALMNDHAKKELLKYKRTIQKSVNSRWTACLVRHP